MGGSRKVKTSKGQKKSQQQELAARRIITPMP
jgi:hypothetical protein